mgnify:CR=1 FL=1
MDTKVILEHCGACIPFFKHMESCPRLHIFESGELLEIFLEIIWVISSALPYLVTFGVIIHYLLRRTSRGFFIMTNLFLHTIACGLLKKYFQQPRPIGACATSFGYPSGHSGWTFSLATWFILEAYVLHEKVSFKSDKFYNLVRYSFFVFVPLIPISRYYLNYHSVEQIMFGFVNGVACALIYFVIVMSVMIRPEDKNYKSIRLWKKIEVEDNFVLYHHEEDEVQEESTVEMVAKRLPQTIHPMREEVRVFFRTAFKRIALKNRKEKAKAI